MRLKRDHFGRIALRGRVCFLLVEIILYHCIHMREPSVCSVFFFISLSSVCIVSYNIHGTMTLQYSHVTVALCPRHCHRCPVFARESRLSAEFFFSFLSLPCTSYRIIFTVRRHYNLVTLLSRYAHATVTGARLTPLVVLGRLGRPPLPLPLPKPPDNGHSYRS